MITFTDKAASKVRQLLAEQREVGAGLGLRVSVRPGGCAGYEYAMAFDREEGGADLVLTADGFDVFVDPDSAPLLGGVRIDYQEGLQGAGFTFDNPNARSSCGCGDSFSAGEESGDGESGQVDEVLVARVREALDGIGAFLRADGGDVELVGMRGRTVLLRLTGACAGCAGAGQTLSIVIERRLQEAVPEVSHIIAV